MIHQDGYLDNPVDRSHRRQNRGFEVSRSTVKYEPSPIPVMLITNILHDNRQVTKDLTGMQVLRRKLSGWRRSNPGHKLERDRDFFQVGVLCHCFWIYPIGKLLNVAQHKVLECVVVETGLPECRKRLFIGPLYLCLWMEQGPHRAVVMI